MINLLRFFSVKFFPQLMSAYFQIGRYDQLPKTICKDCFNKTKQFYKFRNMCIQANIKQHKHIQSEQNKKRKRNEYLQEILKKNKSVKVFNTAEEELIKVLGGKLEVEFGAADSIIIEVQSDEEKTETTQAEPASKILKLPKGITVNPCHSKIGEAVNVKIINGDNGKPDLCLADNYLFEFRLCKGNIV